MVTENSVWFSGKPRSLKTAKLKISGFDLIRLFAVGFSQVKSFR